MADYIGIKGSTIQTIAGDPPAPIAGQVWYNSTATTLKAYGQQGTGAWASGGTLNTGRGSMGSAGTNTAALAIGGNASGDFVESYDGSTWTELAANLPTPTAYLFGLGTQTAALAGGGTGGSGSTVNYTWNETSWTTNNAMATARTGLGGTGTTTAGLIMGGQTPSKVGNTETYDGTTWTEVNALNTALAYDSAGGTQTAALRVFGSTPPNTALIEEWNGTCWTEVADLNQARNSLSSASSQGTVTAMLAIGGSSPATPADTVNTEQYNGTSWTEVANLALGRSQGAGGGTALAAFTTGGSSVSSDTLTSTEIWSIPDATKTFTAT